ncbi:MAG: ribosome silencing factor [Fuerstiella sp.]|nr:ribosome silencing factor [Fuerstiella sp.]
MSSPQLPPDQSAKESNSPQVDSETAGGGPVETEEIVDTSNDTETVTVPRDKGLYQRSLDNAVIAARCADEMRAQDVVVLDMTEIASIVDFFVIGTGTSRRQMHAIADEVNRKMKGDGGNDRLGIEGYRTEANWILMDFGDVVLHVFTEEGRELYDLENLKADAKRIDWQAVTPADG